MTLAGPEIKAGQPAPDFAAVATDLKEAKLADARGKVVVLSSVPSLDTPVCMDLPFAQKRWCGAAGVERAEGRAPDG